MILALFATALGAAAAWMVFLHLRRREGQVRGVPTLLFREASPPAPMAKRSWRLPADRLPLLAGLVGLLLLFLGIGLAWWIIVPEPRPVLVVVDARPSMLARDDTGGKRLDAALAAAESAIVGHAGDLAVVVLDPEPRVLLGLGRDPASRRDVLGSLKPAATASPWIADPGAWLRTRLADLGRVHPTLETWWIGDADDGAIPVGVSRVFEAGAPAGGNTGWSRFAARRDPRDPSAVDLVATLGGDLSRAGRIELRREGRLRDVRRWGGDPSASPVFGWRELGTDRGGAWELRWLPENPGGDSLPEDDVASVSLASSRTLRFRLEGSVPVALARAVAARDDLVAVGAGEPADLVVAGGEAAAREFPGVASVLRLQPPSGAWGQVTGTCLEVLVLPPDEAGDWAGVDPTGLVFESVPRYRPEAGWRVALAGVDADGVELPLVLDRVAPTVRERVLAMDAGRGEWVGRALFPVFVGEWVEAGRGGEAEAVALLPGPVATGMANRVAEFGPTSAERGRVQAFGTPHGRMVAGVAMLWALIEAAWAWRRGGRGRRVERLVLRSLLVAALGVAAFGPVVRLGADRATSHLVDLSASTGGAAAEAARRAGVDAAIVFAAEPRIPDETLPPERLLGATDAGRAADLAALLASPGLAAPPVLWTDHAGASTLVPFSGEDVRVVDAPPPPEPRVVRIEAPRILRAGEPFSWVVEVIGPPGVPVPVWATLGGLRGSPVTVVPADGRARLEVPDRASREESWREAEFSAGLPGAAPLRARRPVRSDARVAWITERPEGAATVAAALRAEGVAVEPRPWTGRLPDLASLGPGTVLVLEDLPPTLLVEEDQARLAAWVREEGGGLLVVAGERPWPSAPVGDAAALLPLRPRFERDEDRPRLSLLIAIDRSGSMAGEKLALAQAAAVAAAEVLSPRDRIGVIGFDATAFWVAEPGAALDRAGLRQRVLGTTSGGGTSFGPALDLATRSMAELGGGRRHLILLTDGQSTPGPHREQVRRLAALGVTVSTVAVGSGADVQLLQLLAAEGGGRFHLAQDPASIPQIFVRETETAARRGIREEPTLVEAAKRGRWLASFPGDDTPRLAGHLLTDPVPGAEIWLTTGGDPLLASWRPGLGRVAMFTADARPNWTREWMAWPRLGPFWAAVMRHLRPPPAGEDAVAFEAGRGGGGTLVAELDPTAPEDAPVAAIVRGPDGSRVEHPFLVDVPGRLRARVDPVAAGGQGAVLTRDARGREVGIAMPAEDPEWVVRASTPATVSSEVPGPGWKVLALAPWAWLAALMLLLVEYTRVLMATPRGRGDR